MTFIINLTKDTATPEQIAVGVVDLPPVQMQSLVNAITVNEPWEDIDIQARAEHVAELACHNGLGGDEGDDPHPTMALIDGPAWIISELEKALEARSIKPVYYFSNTTATVSTKPSTAL